MTKLEHAKRLFLVECTIMSLSMLSIRVVQGWIYWSGGSRRFIYAPQKLDPHASSWMANKLQSAMPGAILGTEHVVAFLLQHFYLLYSFIVLFSLVELVSGLGLLLGFFTRLSGFATVLLSISLMLLFGWQGGTCMDEWSMAVSNLAMGFALTLSGSSIYSVDTLMLRYFPRLQKRSWYTLISSGPVDYIIFKRMAVGFTIFTIAFTLGTYNYYRGAVYSRYHAGPVSPTIHHMTLTNGKLSEYGAVTFFAYVDAGTPALPSNIIRVELTTMDNKIIETWDADKLSVTPMANIKNEFAYNRFKTSEFGIVAPVGAKATILLDPTDISLQLPDSEYQLQVYTINGHKWTLLLKPGA